MVLALIPLLPLVSFVILIFLGRKLGRWAPLVSLAAVLGSLVLSVRLLFLTIHHPSSTLHYSWTWLTFGDRPLTMGFLADPLSVTMCLVVTAVGWLIMLYSIGYMKGDPRYPRFFAYLSLFGGSMLTLGLADHFILLYIGWELVGLCSYLLIGFWFERPAAAEAGKKAFLTTRIGDVGLFAALLLMAQFAGTLRLSDLGMIAQSLGPLAGVVAVLLFWGAVGKSAQFPLHVWLPDAMEGPTPVSALIHAATMVAAGVYLVARTLPIFLSAPQVLLGVAAVGGLTSFFAATIACTQTDLKRILAYSTISQLGFMMLGLGAGSVFAGMFHLVTHACFKALLFLGAGSVIHALHHQEVTRMGGLWRKMPVTALTFTLAAVAMAGIPPLSGFWSKEGILLAVAEGLPFGFLLLALGISGLTAFYIARAVVLVFVGKQRERNHAHESPAVMTIPLALLAVGAGLVGLIASPGSGYFYPHFLGESGGHADAGGFAWVEPVSVAVGAGGILLALLRYGLQVPLLPGFLRAAGAPLYRVAAGKYYVDEFYGAILIRPLLALCRRAFSFDQKVVDGVVNGAGEAGLLTSRLKGWIDRTLVDGAVNGIALFTDRAGGLLRLVQTGRVQTYLLVALAGGFVIFFSLKGNL